MSDCPFCRMVSGEIPVKKVFENDSFMAILDIYPGNPGHVLLLSKEHRESFNEFEDSEVITAGLITKKLSENMIRAFSPEGLTIFLADGAEAGQRAPHTLWHIIPRFPNDSLPLDLKEKEVDSSKFLEKLKPHLSVIPGFFKVEAKPQKEEETKVAPQAKPQGKPAIERPAPAVHVSKKEEKKEGELDLDDVTRLFSK